MLWGSGCLFLAWFGDSFLKVSMRGLSCTNHFPVRWAWKRRCTPPFTFSLTKLRAPWLPFLALPMNFIHNLMYPKDTKNICAGTGHLTSFSHSLPLYLVSGSHPYSLTNYMIYFFFLCFGRAAMSLSISSPPEQPVLCVQERWEILNLIPAVGKSEALSPC